MNVEQIKATVAEAIAKRPPKFDGERLPPATKIAALEDYLLVSAYMQAELEEALFWLDSLVTHFKTKVEQIQGYEALLPSKPQDRITRDDVLRAKRLTDPTTFEAGAEVKQLRETCLRQIDRFRFEAGNGPISRAYTLITAG